MDVVEREMARRGLTNTKLAELMGIDRSNLSRTFNGRLLPGNQFIATLCVVLGESPNDLFMIEQPSRLAKKRAA